MSGVIIDVTTNGAKAAKDLDQINKSLVNIDKTASSSTEKLASLGRSLAGIVASGFSAKYFSSVTSEFTNMSNKIALVTGRTEKLVTIQKQLLAISKETGANASSTVSTFSAFAKSLGGAAGSTKDLLKVTDAVQKAVAISGSSVDSARAAIVQLGQGLASGTLRGEELNSVLEQTPRVAKAIADSLEISTGELRTMAAAGNLTSEVVFQGLLKQTKKLNQEFSLLEPTLDKSFSGIMASVDLYVAQFDKGLGLSKDMAIYIEGLSRQLRSASENAESLGTAMREKVTESLRIAGLVVKPIMKIIEHMGRMLLIALPSASFTRTFVTDIKSALYSVDKMFGGTFTKITRLFQFGFKDLFDYDTEVEMALKQLKRLSPTNWLTAGFDTATFDEFFSVATIEKYGAALDVLATAIGNNYGYIFAQLGDQFRKVEYVIRDALRYLLIIPDTLATFRIGDVEAITYTIAEITRGLSGVQLQIYEFGYMLQETFAPAYMTVFVTLSDMISELPGQFKGSLTTSGDLMVRFGKTLKQMGKDFLRIDTVQLDKIAGALVRFKGAIVKALTTEDVTKNFVSGLSDSLSKLTNGAIVLPKFSDGIIDEVTDIWKKISKAIKRGADLVVDTIRPYHDAVQKVIREFLAPPTSWFEGLALTVLALSGPFGSMIGFLHLVGKGFKSAFDPSLADRVRDTVYDIVNWIAKYNEGLAFSIASWLGLESAFLHSAASLALISLGFGNVVAAGVGVNMMLSSLSYNIGKAFRKNIIEQFISDSVKLFERFTDAVVSMASDLYNKVPKSIRKFSEAVIHEFWKIWDEVIAHSWWTDTIDAVVDTSNSLWSNTQSGMGRFERGVIDAYQRIYRSVSRAISLIKNGDLFSRVSEIGGNIKDAMVRIRDELPTLFRAIVSGIGLAVVTALFPAGALKKIIQAELLTAAITGSALFVEEFSNKFANISAITQLGVKLGETAGVFVNYMVAGIPAFVNAASSAVSGFIRGLTSQIPIVGSLISGVFKAFDVVGLGGAVGLVQLYLFGKAGYGALDKYLKDDNPIKMFMTSVSKNISAFGGGAIPQFLFGSGAATNLTAAMALIATHFGALDSVFQGSRIMKGIAEGGMLWVALTGNTGLDTIKSKALKAAHDIMLGIGKLAAHNATTKSIYDMIFKPSEASGSGGAVTKVVEAALKKVADTVVELSTKIGKRGVDLATLMLFGTNSEDSLNRLKEHLSKFKDTVIAGGAKIVDALRQSKIGEQIAAMYSGSGISQVFAAAPKITTPAQGDLFGASYHKKQLDLFDIPAAVSGMKYIEGAGIDMSNKLNKSFAKTFGTSGMLGMLERNKKALLAMGLLMVSAFAMADDGARESFDKVGSAWDSVMDTINLTIKENPIGTAIGATVLAAIPLILIAFRGLATNIAASLSTAYKSGGLPGIRGMFEGIGKSALEASNKAKMLGAVVSGMAAVGIGNAMGMSPENMAMLAVGLGTVFEVVARYWKGLPGLVGMAFGLIGTVLKGLVVGLLGKILAVVGVVGIIGVMLFGKSEEKGFWANLFGKFDDLKTRMLGLKASARSAVEEVLKPELLKFNNQHIFRVKDDDRDPANAALGGIDYTKLVGKDKERLMSLAEDYAEASKTALKEYEKTKYLREDTKAKVRDTKALLDEAVKDLTDKTILDIEDFADKLKNDVRVAPKGAGQKSQTATEQLKLSTAYYVDKLANDIGGALAFTAAQRGKVARNEESREERKRLGMYDANYFGISPNDQKVQGTLEYLKDAGGESILPSKLKKELAEALQNYETRRVEARDGLGKASVSDRYDAPPKGFFEKDRQLLAKKGKAYEELQGPLEQARLIAARKNESKEFSAEMSTMEKVLKDAGLSMDKLDYATKDWFESLRIDGGAGRESLEKLLEDLKLASSQQERNQIITKIRAVVDIGKVTKEQVDDAFKEVDVKLLRISEKLGIDGKTGLFSGMGTGDQEALYGTLATLDKLKAASYDLMNNKALIENLIPDEELRKKVTRSGALLREYIEAELRKIKDGLEGQAPIQVRMQLAGLSLQDSAGLNAAGINKRLELGDKLRKIDARYQPDSNGKLPELSAEDVAKDAKQYKGIQMTIDRMKVDFKSISSIIGEISGIAQGFSMQEAFRMSPADIDRLREAAATVAEIDKQMNFEGTAGMASSQIVELSRKRVEAENRATDLINKYRLNTTDKLLQAFSSAGISMDLEQLFRLPDSVIESYKTLEKVLFNLKNKFAKGTATDKDKAGYLAAMDEKRGNDDKARGFTDRLSLINEKIGDLGLLPSEFEKYSKKMRDALYASAIEIREAELELSRIIGSGQDGQAAAKALEDLKKRVKEKAQADALTVMDFGRGGQENLKRHNVSVEAAAYNLLNGTQDAIIKSMVENMDAARKNAENPDLPRAARMMAQQTYNELGFRVSEYVQENTRSYRDSPIYQAGQTFAENVKSAFTSGFKDLITGKTSVKDFMTSVMDAFTNGIINSVVDGFMSNFSGKDGILASIGENMFGFGAGLMGGNKAEMEKKIAETRFVDALNGFTNTITGRGIFGNTVDTTSITDTLNTTSRENSEGTSRSINSTLDKNTKDTNSLLGTFGQSMLSFIGMGGALGGMIGGKSGAMYGSALGGIAGLIGNSESWKAASTLNDGNFLGTSFDWIKSLWPFADGGVIPGATGAPMPVLAHGGEVVLNAAQQGRLAGALQGNGQQIFNINITGDVSMQTRKEVMAMIPQIATGVNHHNTEIGNKR